MPATFEVNNGNVTITFAWTVPVAKGTLRVDLMSQELFERGFEVPQEDDEAYVPFEELTNQDKIDKIYSYLTMVIVNMALDRNNKNKKEVAAAAADAEREDIE